MRLRLLPLALCLILAGCSAPGPASPTPTPEPTPTVTPRSAPEWGEQVYMTAYAAEGREESVFSPEYRLPKIENAEGDPAYEAINAYYAAALDDLAVSAAEFSGWAIEDYSISQITGDPFYPYVDSEDFELTMETPTRVSFLRSHSNNLGGPHPSLYPIGDTFDLTTGERLEFADLFTCSAQEAEERVLSAVLERSKDNLDPALLKESYDSRQFYLTEDSLVVYYPDGVLPHAVGSPTFAVAYTELEDILRPWE